MKKVFTKKTVLKTIALLFVITLSLSVTLVIYNIIRVNTTETDPTSVQLYELYEKNVTVMDRALCLAASWPTSYSKLDVTVGWPIEYQYTTNIYGPYCQNYSEYVGDIPRNSSAFVVNFSIIFIPVFLSLILSYYYIMKRFSK